MVHPDLQEHSHGAHRRAPLQVSDLGNHLCSPSPELHSYDIWLSWLFHSVGVELSHGIRVIDSLLCILDDLAGSGVPVESQRLELEAQLCLEFEVVRQQGVCVLFLLALASGASADK